MTKKQEIKRLSQELLLIMKQNTEIYMENEKLKQELSLITNQTFEKVNSELAHKLDFITGLNECYQKRVTLQIIEIQKRDEEIDKLKKENNSLKNNLVSLSSLNELHQQRYQVKMFEGKELDKETEQLKCWYLARINVLQDEILILNNKIESYKNMSVIDFLKMKVN